MAQDLSLDELKEKLQELIDGSEAIQSLSEEEKNSRTEAMMEGTEEEIQEYIKVFENEIKENKKIEEEFEDHSEEIEELIIEDKSNKMAEAREKRNKAETSLKQNDEMAAESLIQKIEKVTNENSQEVNKKSKLNFGWMKGVITAVSGIIGCGLSGILIIFSIILFNTDYIRLEVLFSKNPYTAVHTYWIALIFGALIGLFALPLIRLLKKRGYFISAVIGLVIGGLILAVSHMIFGLTSDIEIIQNARPIGIRAYWIAAGFAFFIGIFAQISNRIISKFKYFNKEV